MMLPASICLFALLALGAALVERRQDDDVPIEDYRRRLLESVVQLGDFVYFDGGRISTYVEGSSDGSGSSVVFNTTRSLRLDVSWSNSSIGQGDIDFVHIYREDPTAVMKGAFWADESSSTIYRWGGERSFQAPMPEDEVALWGFTPNSDGENGTWGRQTPWDAEFFDGLVASTHGGSAVCGNKGYWIGGYGKATTDPFFEDISLKSIPAVPGILEYDFDSRKWKNDSTAPLNSPHGTFINGVAECAQGFRAGPLVVPLAGFETEPQKIQSNSLRGMDNITFWDPTEGRWHWQKATGDVPDGKGKPCSVGTQGDGTYEIVIYGGENKAGQGVSGDVYVLSLPGFRWFKVNGSFPERYDHGCAVVGKGKRQMISTGGVIANEKFNDMDPWPHSIGIFDLTDLVWKSEYDADADEYQTPDVIKQWYDDGGMEDMEWSSDAVRELFVDPDTASENPTEDDSSRRPPSDDSDSSSSSTPTAAIAGGVVGGVVGLAVIGGVVFLLLRRRRRSEAAELSATPQQPFSSPHQPLPGKYHDRSSPMSGMASSSGGVSELPSTQVNSRYELEGENMRTELSGDYSQGTQGMSPGQRHPTGFGSPQ